MTYPHKIRISGAWVEKVRNIRLSGSWQAIDVTPTLDTATEWWTPAVVGSDVLTGQRGTGLDLQFGSTAGAGANDPTVTNDGTYNIVQFRTDDRLQIADNDLLDGGAGDFTILVVAKFAAVGVGAALNSLWRKRNGGTDGIMLYTGAGSTEIRFSVAVGGTSATTTTPSGLDAGTTAIHGVAGRRGSGTITAHLDGSSAGSIALSGTVNTVQTAYVAYHDGSAGYAELDVYGIAWWKGTAVTDADLASAKSELLATAAL